MPVRRYVQYTQCEPRRKKDTTSLHFNGQIKPTGGKLLYGVPIRVLGEGGKGGGEEGDFHWSLSASLYFYQYQLSFFDNILILNKLPCDVIT